MILNPLFSIVIANYNHGRYLKYAIQSLLTQSCQDFELIIVDGGSTDNSIEVIRQANRRIIWWCSEKDKGQSDAFNKGFSRARGQFGCWLNADDVMMPGALDCIAKYLEKRRKVQWIAGSTVFCNGDMKILWCSRCIPSNYGICRYLAPLSVNGPSSFFDIAMFREVGGFDTNLHYTMDIDLWRRFAGYGAKLHHVRKYLWGFRVHMDSKTSHKFFTGHASPEFQTERIMMRQKHGLTKRGQFFADCLCKTARMLSFAYAWSFVDTKRYQNMLISEIPSES